MAVDLSVYDKQKTLADHMRLNEEEQFKRRLLERKLQQDINGSDPAAVKIVNDMQNAARASQDPNLSPQERAIASHRYNLLNQVSKSYAIDRGMEAAPPGFYGAEQTQVPQIPQGDLQDPMAEFTAALNQKAQDGSLSPATGVIPRTSPPPIGGVSEIPGFARTAGNIAATKKGMETQAQKDVELEMNPKIVNREAREKEVGKKIGETRADLGERTARIQQLQSVTKRLSSLGKMATYTMAGRVRDTVMREAGMDVPDAALARAEYIAAVDNEVLPLLRSTFGAQFTENESNSLKVTLGDPNKSPEEKDRVLKSFIRTKMETINSMAREVGEPEPFVQDEIETFVRGLGKPSLYEQGKAEFDKKKKGNVVNWEDLP